MKIQALTPTPAMLDELGQRLARVRKQRGFSQEALAKQAGIGVATLRRIEDGKDARLGSWLRLLKTLQFSGSIDQLLPEDFRSPLHEVRRGRQRRRPSTDRDFSWGDEQR